MAQSRTISHAFVMSQVQLSNSRAGLLTLAAPVCCSGIARHSSVVGEHAQSDLSRKLEPYSKTRRPQSWPQIRLRLAENAARQRPTTKNRMHWDRRMEKQVQITKDAWTRKENAWRNEQQRHSQAVERWELRKRIAEAETDARFLFQSEYAEQVEKRLQAAAYKPWTNSKRKVKQEDPNQEELKREDDAPGQVASPTTPRLNRDL